MTSRAAGRAAGGSAAGAAAGRAGRAPRGGQPGAAIRPTRASIAAPAVMSVLLTLAACSTAPPRPAGDAREARPPSAEAPRARAPSRASGPPSVPLPTNPRGGYYGDDGPPDVAPADLAAIPDAQPRIEPLSPRANRPYVVFGQSYVPMMRHAPYRERGVASWYGRKFHGQPTSIGEPYDMFAMTAAHPTLPIPSYARVTHLRNGRSVVVRVNDRGPFLNSRVIDLSYAAATRLGYATGGSAEVEVELIQPEDIESFRIVQASGASMAPAPAPAAAATPTAPAAVAPAPPASAMSSQAAPAMPSPAVPERLIFETLTAPQAPPPSAVAPPTALPAASAGGPRSWLQLGAFSSRDNAEAARARLARTLDWLVAPIELVEERGLFKLQAGPLAPGAAREAADRIHEATAFRPFAITR